MAAERPYSSWSAIRSALNVAIRQSEIAQKYEHLSAELDEIARQVSDEIAENASPPATRAICCDVCGKHNLPEMHTCTPRAVRAVDLPMRLGEGATQAAMPDPITWQHAAQVIGESLTDTGPDGYYAMRSDEWLAWAHGCVSKNKAQGERRAVTDAERLDMLEHLLSEGDGVEFRYVDATPIVRVDQMDDTYDRIVRQSWEGKGLRAAIDTALARTEAES